MKNRLSQPVVVGLLAALACFCWGSAYPAVKIGYEWFQVEDISSQILFAGYRFTLAGMLTYLIGSFMAGRPMTAQKENIPSLTLLGLIQTGIHYLFFYIGLANTTGVKGSIINPVNAFASIILAHFFIKGERINRRKIAGCVLGAAGIILINFSEQGMGGGFKIQGEGFLIIANILYGVAAVMIKKMSLKTGPMMMTAGQLMLGGSMLIATGLLFGGRVSGFTLAASALLFYMAVISAAAFSIWTLLLKYNKVGEVAVYLFLIPVFGVLLSGIFLGEAVFTIRNMAALLLVCSGVYVVNRTH